ncbi:hypothetical protein CHS0354_004375 [Potamilus streckersoni]|uniref:RCC1-like domain-containing protein n=1 Tax=Potamilus streckersoni TaxID=2493646 RepID=A0AAE0SZX2_9BIVA|nr:hypothetical protein CHS0354_004375 [Potamilus streckersoni]
MSDLAGQAEEEVEENKLDNSEEGRFICWGCGEFGQHCHGQTKDVSFADGLVSKFSKQYNMRIKLVGCGASHTVAVTNSNDILVWGNGNSGQLGCNDTSTYWEPQKISLYSIQTTAPDIAGVSCGGRHTMVWLKNGHVFTFGNNFYAQLGYDFKEKNYKDKQAEAIWEREDDNAHNVTQPHLLKTLTHRPVAQVACGEKHSVFRFQDGAVACVGNNSHGQIGRGNQEEAVVPYFLEDFNDVIVYIAAGANHTLAVTECGEVFVWGYSKACGNRIQDVLFPQQQYTHRNNVVSVAGGSNHSVALTANGSVYTWGYGPDGQLGHGEKILFLSKPRHIPDGHLFGCTVKIACGEAYSSAINENGDLFMWGKNSHIIVPSKPTSYKFYKPYCMNQGIRRMSVSHVFCGSWHAAAFTGTPAPLVKSGEESGESSLEEEDELGEDNPGEDEFLLKSKQNSVNGEQHNRNGNHGNIEEEDDSLGKSEIQFEFVDLSVTEKEINMTSREQTKMSLAEFYAPTPDIRREFNSPSPTVLLDDSTKSLAGTNSQSLENKPVLMNTNGAKSFENKPILVVQIPTHSRFVDAATSPMTCSLTTSSETDITCSVHSQISSPIHEPETENKFEKYENCKPVIPEIKRKPHSERKLFSKDTEKSRVSLNTPISETVQFSRTPADSFKLPRENTTLSRKHVDFAEMEEARLHGPIRSPDKFSSRQNSRHDASPPKLKSRNSDNQLSFKSDQNLEFRVASRLTDPLSARDNWSSAIEWDDDKISTRPRVPKHPPKIKPPPPKPMESNFGLQISRSKTVVGPLSFDVSDPLPKTDHMRRYSSMHNPQSPTMKNYIDKPLKPRLGNQRHVSIPASRPELMSENVEKLCVEGLIHSNAKPIFSSASSWRDKSDLERLQLLAHKKGMSAGLVRMYIETGTTSSEISRYPNIIRDNTQNQKSQNFEEPLIVQPLFKGQITYSETEDPVSPWEKKHIDRNQKLLNRSISKKNTLKTVDTAHGVSGAIIENVDLQMS